MTSPYRNETEALAARKADLERELASIDAQTSDLEKLRTRQAEARRELASIDETLRTKTTRRLPLLDNISVASPCNANWDDMVGDARVRFCLSCEKNVYNLSEMPRAEAESFLAERAGGEICVRYYQRSDGTVMTSDCPVGVKKKRRKKLALAVAAAGATALAATQLLAANKICRRQGAVMGEAPIAMTGVVATPTPIPEPTERATMGEYMPDDIQGKVAVPVPVMGSAVRPPPPSPPTPVPPTHVKMGKPMPMPK